MLLESGASSHGRSTVWLPRQRQKQQPVRGAGRNPAQPIERGGATIAFLTVAGEAVVLFCRNLAATPAT